MTVASLSAIAPYLQLREHIHYPALGITSKALWQNESCQYSLLCIAADSKIPEHQSAATVTIQVLEGTGSLGLNGDTILLEPGVFVLVPADAPHDLTATSNLAFILTRTA